MDAGEADTQVLQTAIGAWKAIHVKFGLVLPEIQVFPEYDHNLTRWRQVGKSVELIRAPRNILQKMDYSFVL